MVFRRDSKVDAFQRQISALRHQLGGEGDAYTLADRGHDAAAFREVGVHGNLPDLDVIRADLGNAVDQGMDGQGQGQAMSSPLPPIPALDMNTSVISHSTSWNGNFESSGSLHVYGRVEGTLTAKVDIFIAEEAVVDAQVSAANVMIAGSVRGTIHCSSRFEVLPRGRVSGDVRAPAIVVHDGAILACDIAMSAASNGSPAVAASSGSRSLRNGA